MKARTLSRTLFPLAALALCSSLTLAQQTPDTPAPAAQPDAAAPAPAAPAPQVQPAPIERHGVPAEPREPRAPRPPRPPRAPEVKIRPMGPIMLQDHGNHDGPIVGAMGFSVERKWWQDTAVAQELNLTPAQVKRMDTIFEESKLRLIDARANVEKQEVLLEPLLSANPVDAPKASLQIDKVANARADLEKANAKMLLGIRGVLTADQWTKLNERHHGRLRDGFEYHGAPPTPGAVPAPAPVPGAPGH